MVLRNSQLFYIKDRNQTTTVNGKTLHILKLFYIKDRNQTTTTRPTLFNIKNYFTSKIEIKPQRIQFVLDQSRIILHQRSKSNHNIDKNRIDKCSIILHQRSKSNHNFEHNILPPPPLFYIKDRNQTTTV